MTNAVGRMKELGLRARIDAAVEALNQAKKINDGMQKRVPTGGNAWHEHETIDDKLHEVLAALGD